MKKKSKFKSFILSAIPGLGHIYQGFTNRGIIFMGASISILFLMQVLQSSGGSHYDLFKFNLTRSYINVLELLIPLIWAASILDNLIFADKIKNGTFNTIVLDGSNGSEELNDITRRSNKKLVAILLNIVPGSGHIYLGLRNKGVQLMSYFFILYFISEFTAIDIFNIPVALLWLYSILDTVNITSYTNNEVVGKELVKFEDISILFTLQNNMHWAGGALIFLGVLVLGNRAAADFIDPEILRLVSGYLRDGIISLIFIVIGIKMLLGSKKRAVNMEEER